MSGWKRVVLEGEADSESGGRFWLGTHAFIDPSAAHVVSVEDIPEPKPPEPARLCISCGHMHPIPLRPGPTARALLLVVTLVAIGLFFVAYTAWGNGWRP